MSTARTSSPSAGEFTFIHAADLHLDSPLVGLQKHDGAPVAALRGATRRALENLVKLCLDEKAAFLVLAGDLFDGAWKDYGTGLFFVKQMKSLQSEGVRVFLVRGNHDAKSQMTKKLQLPDNVHVFGTTRASTELLPELRVAIHGRSYAKAATTDNLAKDYPDPVSGSLNIGVLHTALGGGGDLHANYAPCTKAELLGKGYDYWALGHVHQREVVSEDPWIVFPGNLQGRHARELGEKGAEVVSVSGGAVQSVEHRPLDVVRWVHREVDVSGAQNVDQVIERVREDLLQERDRHGDRLVAARVTIVGRTEAHNVLVQDLVGHQERVRADLQAADSDEERLWLEKVRFSTRSTFDLDALRTEEGPMGELLRTLGEIAADEEALASLASTLDGLAKKDALLFGRTHVTEGASSGLEPPSGFPSLAATGTDRVAAVRSLCGELDELIVARLLEVN